MDERPSEATEATPTPSAPIVWRATARFATYSLLLPVILFGAAGRVNWGMGWLYVGLLFVLTIGTRLLLMRVNPALLAERASALGRADAKAWDKALVPVVVLVGPIVTWIVTGLDQRFGWTPVVPVAVQWAAVVAIVLGGVFTAWAMVTNRFFSAVVRIQHDRGQVVVMDGPYRFVRHPGYAGALLVTVASPLMLDACWAGVPTALVIVASLVRTGLEDRTLHAELPGYAEYAQRTRYRILPGLW